MAVTMANFILSADRDFSRRPLRVRLRRHRRMAGPETSMTAPASRREPQLSSVSSVCSVLSVLGKWVSCGPPPRKPQRLFRDPARM